MLVECWWVSVGVRGVLVGVSSCRVEFWSLPDAAGRPRTSSRDRSSASVARVASLSTFSGLDRIRPVGARAVWFSLVSGRTSGAGDISGAGAGAGAARTTGRRRVTGRPAAAGTVHWCRPSGTPARSNRPVVPPLIFLSASIPFSLV